jgi:hypothetical protein
VRKFAITAASVVALAGTAAPALAAPNPAGTGQPGVATPNGADCATPGLSSPNGFNSGGFANAETLYANPGTTPGNQQHAISEYDIACYQVSQH